MLFSRQFSSPSDSDVSTTESFSNEAVTPFPETGTTRLTSGESLSRSQRPAFSLTKDQRTLFGAVSFALIFWWFSTAVIMYLSFIPEARAATFFASLFLAIASLYLLIRLRNTETPQAVFLTFTAGVMIWAFVEVSFYSGFIVGPRVRPIFSIKPTMDTFFQAVHQSAYHEGLVLILAIVIGCIAYRARNKFGLYVYLMFWFMHQSAKLNIFLGVMNTGKELVPETVESMTVYMTIAHMNWLFPFSVTLCSYVTFHLWNRIKASAELWKKTGYALIGTMSILALLEHWLLVVPLNQSIWDIVVKKLH